MKRHYRLKYQKFSKDLFILNIDFYGSVMIWMNHLKIYHSQNEIISEFDFTNFLSIHLATKECDQLWH